MTFTDIFGSIRQAGISQFGDDKVYITAVDTANNAITLSDTSTTGGSIFAIVVNAGRDQRTGALLPFMSNYDRAQDDNSEFVVGKFNWRNVDTYGYPESGPVIADLTFSGDFTADDFVMDFSNVATRALFSVEAPRTAVRFGDGITIGKNTTASTVGIGDTTVNFGINHMWDGLGNIRAEYDRTEFEQYEFVPGFTILNFTDGTAGDFNIGGYATNKTATGPRLLFSAAYGNVNTPRNDKYVRANQELGRIAFLGANYDRTAVSTRSPSAGISAAAGNNDWSGAGQGSSPIAPELSGNANMYFWATSNLIRDARDVFMSYEGGELNLGSGFVEDRKPIKLSPSGVFRAFGDPRERGNPQNTYTGRNWMVLNSANIAADSGGHVSITNGDGITHVGDHIFSIQRNDNSVFGYEANNVFFVSTGLLDAVFQVSGLDSDAVGVCLPLDAFELASGDPVTFANVNQQGANLNGNTYYVAPTPVDGFGTKAYVLYTDAGLTTVLTWTALSGSTFQPGSFGIGSYNGQTIYDILSGVTDRNYTFTLAEQSDDLVMSTNGNTLVTFTPDGDVTATGVVEADALVINDTANVTGNINLGTNSSINYDAVYGCFHNLSNVTAAAADTVYAFQWPNVHVNTNRVTVESNSQITIQKTGAYMISLEMQAQNTGNQERTAFLWLAKNGTDIPETTVRVSLIKELSQVIVKEWLVEDIQANDYVEVRFAVDNVSNIQLTSIPAQSTPYLRPAVPSAVLTVTPVGA